jgi:hypothetical protein
MDFKALISKLDSMDTPPQTPSAPVLPQAVQLNEDAQLRVLAGQTTYVAEAKKKKDDEMKEEMKVGDKKPSSTGGTIEKTATGVKHHAGKNYGGDKAPKDDEEDAPKAKKAKKESVEPEFKSKFMKMVEAKKEEADKKKADAKKKKMDEAARPDYADIDDDGDEKETMKDAAADKKAGNKGGDKKDSGKKGMSDAQKKYFGGKNESKTQSKKVVAESVESKMSFKEMIKLVQESGGQQQIDALDQDLFAWAQRVARNKFDEGMKAEVYAGLVYERMGGRFEMFDVLSEDQK